MNVNFLKVSAAVLIAVLFMSVSTFAASKTDKQIVSSAKQSYVFKTYLKDDSIKVQSRSGVVTLTGTVATESHKSLAKETVASLSGVKSVDNQLAVKGDRPAKNSDAWITLQVKYALYYHQYVSGFNTQVSTANGIVTLRGEAVNRAEKDLAEEYAKDIEGVKDVNNEMTFAQEPGNAKKSVGDRIDDASITAQVKMAFVSHRSTSALKTGVTTNNGVVTLTGKASTGAGKDIAAKVARDVNGVNQVINNMTIETVSANN